KVLVSTGVFLQKLVAARLAADLCDVSTILIARTDANSAKLITTDVDPRDQPFIVGAERTTEGFHRFRGGIDASIARGIAYAAYAELQDAESGAKADGYRAFEHQTFVGTAYFDEIAQVVTGGDASTLAMAGSTEKEQFQEVGAKAEPIPSSAPRLNASETG